MEMDYTRKFSIQNDKDPEIKKILSSVYQSLQEKGYNPINQIVGYILSEDPTYITNYNNARALIRKLDRDDKNRGKHRHGYARHQPVREHFGDHNHGQGLACEQHLLERAIGVVGRKHAGERQQRRKDVLFGKINFSSFR